MGKPFKKVIIPAMLLGAALACAGPSRTDAGPATEATTQPWSGDVAIKEAVENLANDDFQMREKAQRFLEAHSSEALAALKAARNDADPERSHRAQQALRNIALGITPGTPAELVSLLNQYKSGDQGMRYQAMMGLVNLNGRGDRYVLRLLQAEDAPGARQTILGGMVSQTGRFVPALVAAGDEKSAEAILSMGVQQGDLSAAVNAAKYWQAKGEGEKMLHPVLEQPLSPAATVVIHRALGDTTTAREVALGGQNPALAQEELFFEGDWKALSDRLQPADSGWAGFPAEAGYSLGIHELAGKADQAKAVLDAMTKDAAGHVGAAWEYGKGLMLTGHGAEAMVVWQKEPMHARSVADALMWRGEFDQALKLVDDVARSHPERAFLMQLERAKVLSELGETEKARSVFQAAWEEHQNGDDKDIQELISAEATSGDEEQARAHVAQLLARGRDASAVAWLYPGHDFAGKMWWDAIAAVHPEETVGARLSRLDAVMNSGPQVGASAEALSRLAAWTHDHLPEFAGADGGPAQHMLEEVVIRFAAKDCRDLALPFAEELAKGTGSARLVLALGIDDAADGRWSSAERYFRRAVELEPTSGAALFGAGYAARQRGDAAAGKELSERSRQYTLGREDQLATELMFLEEIGDWDAAAPVVEDLFRCGIGPQQQMFGAVRGSYVLRMKHDYSGAAQRLEQMILLAVHTSANLAEQRDYLGLPRTAIEYEAEAELAAGDVVGALAVCFKALEISPIDPSIACTMVPMLEGKGEKGKADQLFQAIWKRYDAALRKYPDDAMMANSGAWLAAKCHRELDWALEKAAHAVALQPNKPQCLDTLAEVYLARGDAGKAVALEKHCLGMSNAVIYRQQLLRFEGALKDRDKGK